MQHGVWQDVLVGAVRGTHGAGIGWFWSFVPLFTAAFVACFACCCFGRLVSFKSTNTCDSALH